MPGIGSRCQRTQHRQQRYEIALTLRPFNQVTVHLIAMNRRGLLRATWCSTRFTPAIPDRSVDG